MNHTKEPWHVEYDDAGYITINDDTGYIMLFMKDDELEMTASNAKRIVACVNACAGITNEALEAGVVHSSLINFEESLDLEKGEKFCFYNIPILEEA